MGKYVKRIFQIFIVMTLSVGIIYSCSNISTTNVTFINNEEGTLLGIVKFVVINNDVVDYEVMSVWKENLKVIVLEEGMYGVTQYNEKDDLIINYRQFVIKKHHEPIQIIM
jgi:hypothetical protein